MHLAGTVGVDMGGQDQSSYAIELFQISPRVSDFQILKHLPKNIYCTCIYSFVYRLHITENDREKLLLYLVLTNVRT